jgi:hypothetical protein
LEERISILTSQKLVEVDGELKELAKFLQSQVRYRASLWRQKHPLDEDLRLADQFDHIPESMPLNRERVQHREKIAIIQIAHKSSIECQKMNYRGCGPRALCRGLAIASLEP